MSSTIIPLVAITPGFVNSSICRFSSILPLDVAMARRILRDCTTESELAVEERSGNLKEEMAHYLENWRTGSWNTSRQDKV